MTAIRFYILFLSLLFPFFTEAQVSIPVKVSGNTSANALVHNETLPPLWQVARQEGRWDYLGGNQILGIAGMQITGTLTNSLTFQGKIEMDYNSRMEKLYLHTGWAGVKWGHLSVKAGRHLFAPIFTSDYSGSGSYLFGDNHRPMNRITLEIADFAPLPYTDDRLEVRGGISQGWLNDDRGEFGNSNVLLHEKYAYIRWNSGRWKPYLGLNHSSLFGGTHSNGDDIPVDFWATFFAQGSKKIGGGEAANAAGAHMGLYDFGFFANTPHGAVQIYYQIPFSDGSGMLFWHRNTDHVAGINWQVTGINWLSNLTIEWAQTTYQSGNGMPDPGAIVDDKYVSITEIMNMESTSAFMLEYFDISQDEWTTQEVKDVLKEQVNHGNEFGGRDGYMNNGLYPGGWTHHGQVMGSPLNLTREQMLYARPNVSLKGHEAIVNDRFSALHAGAKGNILPQLRWNAMITWSRNFGSYYSQYPGRYTWNEAEDYWFKGGREQWYMLFGLQWTPSRLEQLSFNSTMSMDTGEIYQSAGFTIGVSYKLY